MVHSIIIGALALAIIIPIGAFFIGGRKPSRFKSALRLNVVSFFGVMLFATVFLFAQSASAAAEGGAGLEMGLRAIGAALATGMSTIGAGVATGSAASAALGALSENDAIMGKALILVALAEGIAIYGLIISLLILG